jgi:hypothetical protein
MKLPHMMMILAVAGLLLRAENYGIEVSIERYENLDPLPAVKKDRQVFTQLLKRLKVKRVIRLHDANATKKSILHALKRIETMLQSGDRFYFFYAGHGSDLYDPLYTSRFQKAGLTEWMRNSGMIFPTDFDPSIPGKSGIIGKRDLRGILEKIDKKVAFGLIVFDACYSENSIRTDGERDSSQALLGLLTDRREYPYQHLVYIASSIDLADPGVLPRVLERCLRLPTTVKHLGACLEKRMRKSAQIPVFIVPKGVRSDLRLP